MGTSSSASVRVLSHVSTTPRNATMPPKYGGSTGWATTNHAPVSSFQAPTNKFAGGQKYSSAGKHTSGSNSGRVDTNGASSGGNNDTVKCGLPQTSYSQQPSWATSEQHKNSSGQHGQQDKPAKKL